jgi:hypothetical protein
MASNDLIPASEAYAYTLLEKWVDIMELSEEYRKNVIGNRIDNQVLYEYVAKLTRFWVELLPKIEGSGMDSGFITEYKSFNDIYEHPELPFTQPTANAPRVAKLERVVRTALEKLKITQFER